jgi:cellulose synthase/poly-beta-1,6-N-acetylglucosamine synthase-like glycosyltransferase
MCSPISVIVITFNEESNIRECLDSLTALDYPADLYEIIVVDASMDATPRIVEEFPRVRLVRSQKGFSQQKNAGLRHAAFDIVAFTDADCVIPPDWLRVIDRAFRDERVAAGGGNAFPPPGTGRFGLWTACVGHPAGGALGFDANVERGEGGIAFVPGCNSVFRKAALQDINGFDPHFFEGGEDVDASRRLRKKGYYLDYIPELTVYHKPRATLWGYWKWNIQVGTTKYSLRRPSLGRLVLQPSFPLWSIAALFGIIWLEAKGHPTAALILAATLWSLLIGVLLILAKPFRLLIKRRRKIGVRLVTVMTVIPGLIYLRQVGIDIGQIRKWRQVRRAREFRQEQRRGQSP